MAERRTAGQLEPLVAIWERVREGLEQKQLSLPGIEPREHSDAQRRARLVGVWP